MTEYAFHPEALLDLDEIWEFIAKDSLDAADRVVAEILAACDGLCLQPGQGHHRPELTMRPLRLAIVRDFLLVYAPEEQPLWVVAILHGRRNPRVLAAILRDRG